MGVMSCSRPSCPNIMCQTYVNSIGYVCTECQNEFKDYLKKEQLTPKTEGEIKNQLVLFMETDKDRYVDGDEISVDDFFNSYD